MASRLKIGIAGAGLLGRLLAWRLAAMGHEVSVFDPAPDAQPRHDGRQAAAFSAAGMLSPLAELENASDAVATLGMRSLALWRDLMAQLPGSPFHAQRGSLLVAHSGDLGTAVRMLARLRDAPAELRPPQLLDRATLAQLEPALHGLAHAWLLPDEGQIDPVQALGAMHIAASQAGVLWHWGQSVSEVLPNALTLDDGIREGFDWVFDVRGVGAKVRCSDRPRDGFASSYRSGQDVAPKVRGVRGETVWLHAPDHGLSRPVRLLHPRHRVYVVPRPGDIIVVGATEIESEDRSPVSLRSAVELMAAAHSVMPSLAEARIVRLDSNLRPALPDNEPRIEMAPGRVRINGLFRHGWLVAPAMVQDALTSCGLKSVAPQQAMEPCA